MISPTDSCHGESAYLVNFGLLGLHSESLTNRNTQSSLGTMARSPITAAVGAFVASLFRRLSTRPKPLVVSHKLMKPQEGYFERQDCLSEIRKSSVAMG